MWRTDTSTKLQTANRVQISGFRWQSMAVGRALVNPHSSLLGSSCLTRPRRPLALALRRSSHSGLLHLFLACSCRRRRLFRRSLRGSLCGTLCGNFCSRARTPFGVGAVLERGRELLSMSVVVGRSNPCRDADVMGELRAQIDQGTRHEGK
jgi:hypothetical protein